MPWKDINKQREAIRHHYYANKQKYIDKAIKRKKELRKWVNGIKEASPCMDCKKQYPYYVMDFDHVSNKSSTINSLIDNCSKSGILKEIAKCEIVCANCHRFRTHKRLSGV